MLNDLRNKVFKREQDGHSAMLHKSIFVFGIKTASSFIGLAIILFLSNVLGEEGLGHYQYAFTWTSVISLVAVSGFDRLMIREFSRWRSEGMDGLLMAFFKKTNLWILLISILFAGIAFGVSFLPIDFFKDDTTRTTYRLAMAIIPFLALVAHRRSALNGIREVVISSIPDQIIQPSLLLLVAGIVWIIPGIPLTPESAILVNIGSWGTAFVVAHLLFVRKGPRIKAIQTDRTEHKKWWKLAFTILIFNLSMVIFARIDVLMLRPMLGPVEGAKAVGLYGVAFKLAAYLNFLLVAFNGVIAPSIAQYYHEGKRKELQHMVTKMVRSTTVLATPVALILIFGSTWVLSFFGDGFESAGFMLVVLVLGQMVNIAVGPVGNLLIMTNHEKIASLCFVISTLLNVGLNLWLIPLYSYEGAAIATSISLAFNNILMLVFVVVRLKINPTVFAF